MAEEKTNVMRVLDQKKVPYTPHWYDHPEGAVDGVSVAALIGKEPGAVCKTLVTQGSSKKYYVFVIPVAAELDLKKAAKAAGEKSVEMLPQKELFPLTGYVHGGCSPLGMKKLFPTFFHETAKDGPLMMSAGKVGVQLETTFEAVKIAIPAGLCDLIRS